MLQLSSIHSPVPLQLILALVFKYKVKIVLGPDGLSNITDHDTQFFVIIHPGAEGSVVSVRTLLYGVGGETDQIEISLHEVEDQSLPANLFVLRGHVILPLGLNDALP